MKYCNKCGAEINENSDFCPKCGTSQKKADTEIKRLYRSKKDKILGGVCGGMAEYFNIDPTLIRILWVIFTLMGGSGILAYIICWIIIPENPGQ